MRNWRSFIEWARNTTGSRPVLRPSQLLQPHRLQATHSHLLSTTTTLWLHHHLSCLDMFRRVLSRHLRSLTRHPRRRSCLIVRETSSSHHLSYKAPRHHHISGQAVDPQVLAVHYPHQLVQDVIRIGEQSDFDLMTREQTARFGYR